jgi:hypothetical protein
MAGARPPATLLRGVPGRTKRAIAWLWSSSASTSAVPRNPVDPETKMRIGKTSPLQFSRYGARTGKVN